MVREQNGRLKFGPGEWIGLFGLAVTPAASLALGLTAWGMAIDRRVTRVEERIEAHLPAIAEQIREIRSDLRRPRPRTE
jgi:hypothetical protein